MTVVKSIRCYYRQPTDQQFKYLQNYGVGPHETKSYGWCEFRGTNISTSDNIKLTISLFESLEDLQDSSVKSSFSAVTNFATHLQVPTGGDVVFRIRDSTKQSPQNLYTYGSVLSANSEYFAARLKPEWREKDAAPESQSDNRQLIDLDEDIDDIDFVTLHNILYYIYTGCVNLHYNKDDLESHNLPKGYPAEPDPIRLYRNADKYLLPDLKDRCCNHIRLTLTPENVAEKLFSADGQHHQELQNIFLAYLLEHFDKVRVTTGWEKALCEEGDIERSLLKYRLRMIFEINKKSNSI